MKQLLHLTISPRTERSHSRALSNHFVSGWQARFPDGQVVTRDLCDTLLPHVTEPWVIADITPEEARTPAQKEEMHLADTLLDELISANGIVIGTPIYNFGLPSALAAWLAHIVLAGRAFTRADNESGFAPLLKDDKPIWVCVASGRSGYQRDGSRFFANSLEPQLRNTFEFIGLNQMEFFYAGGDLSGKSAEEVTHTMSSIDEAISSLSI